MARQARRALKPDSAVELLLMDGRRLDREEAYRTGGLLFAWLLLLLIGALTTAALSRHGPIESASGMFSALGNIGPCYISVADMARLNPAIKIVYIIGMLAGRLEIIPLLMLFHRRAWT
jgi:trk system potassium uptake protein TrkH